MLKTYSIDLRNLSNQSYDYQFAINDAFFEAMDTELLDKGNLLANVSLKKSDTMLILDFEIKGTLGLICDRSLDPFDYWTDVKERLILQYAETAEVLGDDMETIPYHTLEIQLAQYLYEFLAVAVPMKKLHPRFANEAEADNGEELILVYSSTDTEEQPIDPRWEALKNLK
jgi:uncharacterized metal-binding protein YceD (DUF177 family)